MRFFQRRITWNPPDPNEIQPNLIKILSRSDEIQQDLVKIWPNLDRSGQISATSQRIRPNIVTSNKTRNWPIQLKTWRDLNLTIRLAFQVGFGFCFHRPKSFESSPGRGTTQPGPTFGQPYPCPIAAPSIIDMEKFK